MDSKIYNADSIKILGDIEHIIARRGMYIGDANDPRQLLSEIFDNAIDEVQAGFSPELIVIVNTKKNSYTVRDYGRGIPHGQKLLDNGVKKEIVEVLCTKSNSGGKFDNNSYNYSSGLNGLGLTITNALSSSLTVISYRGTKAVAYRAHNGIGEVEYIDCSDRGDYNDGTEVTFIPNPEMFRSSKVPVDFIKNRCKIASALGFRARLVIDGEEIDTNASIYDLITEDNENVSTYSQIEPIEITIDSGEKMKVAIRYTSEVNDRYFGFTNLLFNSLGGTHVRELSKYVISAWKKFIESNKKLKPDTELRPSDYLVGMRGICAVFISKPEFSSQTKEKLTVHKSYFTEMMSQFETKFIEYLQNNLSIAQAMIKRFEEYRNAQNKLLARKEISSLIKINNDDPSHIRRRSVVPKLIECTSKKRDNTELFLTEGDSAAGPAARARNKTYQAVLPLRGKIMNITYMDPKKAVKSQEVCNITNAIGCGIGSQCDSSKSRYERIIINADADPDGLNIICLVLSVFVNMLPDIVKDGRLFIAEPPLYGWKDKSGYHYSNDRNEIPKNVKFTRYKGLGEMDDEEFAYCCMNPESRKLIQVEYPSDIDKFNFILGTSKGKADLLTELGIVRYE